MVPTSTQPKPSIVRPRTPTPFLSKPAARPNTAGTSRPKADTGARPRLNQRRSSQPTPGTAAAQRMPTKAMWWARSGSMRRKTWLNSSRYTPATYPEARSSRGRVRDNHQSPRTGSAAGT